MYVFAAFQLSMISTDIMTPVQGLHSVKLLMWLFTEKVVGYLDDNYEVSSCSTKEVYGGNSLWNYAASEPSDEGARAVSEEGTAPPTCEELEERNPLPGGIQNTVKGLHEKIMAVALWIVSAAMCRNFSSPRE